MSLQNTPRPLCPPSFLFFEQYCDDIKGKVDQASIAATHLRFSVFENFFTQLEKSHEPDKPSLDVLLEKRIRNRIYAEYRNRVRHKKSNAIIFGRVLGGYRRESGACCKIVCLQTLRKNMFETPLINYSRKILRLFLILIKQLLL